MGKRMNLYVKDVDGEEDSFRVHYKGQWFEALNDVLVVGDYEGNVTFIGPPGKPIIHTNREKIEAMAGAGGFGGTEH